MKQENTYILNLEAAYIYKNYYEQLKKITEDIKTIKELKNMSKEDRKLAKSKNDIIKNNIKNIKTIADTTYINKLYTATIPYSLETIRMGEDLNTNACKEFSTNGRENNRQETKILININFEKEYKIFEKIKDKDGNETGKSKVTKTIKKKTIRKHLYNNGFYLTHKDYTGETHYIHYVVYKRGASKAKQGSALFIKEEFYEYFKNRSRLGIKFEKDELMDLTSVWAYESLILSGIDFTIELDPKTEILLIDDIYGKEYESKASKTFINEKGELETKNDEHYKAKNCLTDGQSLMDESIFNKYYTEKHSLQEICKSLKRHKKYLKLIRSKGRKKYDYYIKSPKSMMLLRTDWLKSNAINCCLHKFLMENAENGKVKDILRGELDASKIKLVITPNSLKWLKLKDKFNGDKKKCYEYWLDNINSEFGVVKQDKEGNFGTCNRLTYQLLNSLNLTKDEVFQLCTEELEYIKLLKNDNEVFKNYVANNMCMLDLEKSLNYIDDGEEYINYINKDEIETPDMINNLLALNDDFQYTEKFANWRYKQIQDYIENLKKAKLRLKDTKYCTIVANPYEFLLATVGKYEEGKSICEGREVWCSYKGYKEGQEFCISRNPHINIANVMWAKNKFHKEYSEWFNFSENMVIVNINDNDMPMRGQGFDEDSDTLLMLPSKLLSKKALDSYKWYTPTNGVKGTSKLRKNNMNELAELDDMLQNNLIGKIINTSQIYNSYMNEAIYNEADEDTINRLFDCSSALSSLSQIEIDKSKKSFDNLKIGQELKKIKKATDKNGNELIEHVYRNKINVKKYKSKKHIFKTITFTEIKKTVVPIFFNVIADNSEYREYKAFKTSMDYLQEIMEEEVARKIRDNTKKKFKEILVKEANLPKNLRRNGNQIDKIFEIVEKYSRELNKLKITKADEGHKTLTEILKTDDKIKAYKSNRKKDALKELAKIKVNAKTILQILIKCFPQDKIKNDWTKYAMNTMNLMYEAYTKDFLMCFKTEHTENNLILEESEGGEIYFWNKYYEKISIKEYLKKYVA